jgi:hypothetical protein
MNAGIKIIKRGRVKGLQVSPLGPHQTIRRQSDRQIANAVKNWIAELAQRKRVDEHNSLLRSRVG